MSDTAQTLMERAAHARREDRLEAARRDLVDAVALARAAGAREDLIAALKALGQIERDLGRHDAALVLYEEAVGLCRGAIDPLQLAHTVRHLGDIHLDAGRLEAAEPCFREALALYRGHGHAPPLELANAIRPLARLRERTGDMAEAVRLWSEARDLYMIARVEQGVAESTARLARLTGRSS